MFDTFVIAARTKAGLFAGKVKEALARKHEGIDGILVTVGLCIIALVLIVVMKDQIANFIKTLVASMTEKAQNILSLNN